MFSILPTSSETEGSQEWGRLVWRHAVWAVRPRQHLRQAHPPPHPTHHWGHWQQPDK